MRDERGASLDGHRTIVISTVLLAIHSALNWNPCPFFFSSESNRDYYLCVRTIWSAENGIRWCSNEDETEETARDSPGPCVDHPPSPFQTLKNRSTVGAFPGADPPGVVDISVLSDKAATTLFRVDASAVAVRVALCYLHTNTNI